LIWLKNLIHISKASSQKKFCYYLPKNGNKK